MENTWLATLAASHEEYKLVERLMKLSIPNVLITKVNRVQNATLWYIHSHCIKQCRDHHHLPLASCDNYSVCKYRSIQLYIYICNVLCVCVCVCVCACVCVCVCV